MIKTFKDINKEGNVDLEVKKAGLSLAIVFSKEFIKRFNIEYGDTIRLDGAILVKNDNK